MPRPPTHNPNPNPTEPPPLEGLVSPFDDPSSYGGGTYNKLWQRPPAQAVYEDDHGLDSFSCRNAINTVVGSLANAPTATIASVDPLGFEWEGVIPSHRYISIPVPEADIGPVLHERVVSDETWRAHVNDVTQSYTPYCVTRDGSLRYHVDGDPVIDDSGEVTYDNDGDNDNDDDDDDDDDGGDNEGPITVAGCREIVSPPIPANLIGHEAHYFMSFLRRYKAWSSTPLCNAGLHTTAHWTPTALKGAKALFSRPNGLCTRPGARRWQYYQRAVLARTLWDNWSHGSVGFCKDTAIKIRKEADLTQHGFAIVEFRAHGGTTDVFRACAMHYAFRAWCQIIGHMTANDQECFPTPRANGLGDITWREVVDPRHCPSFKVLADIFPRYAALLSGAPTPAFVD